MNLAYWHENGYLVRLNVFTAEENDVLRQVAEDVIDGKKRPFPVHERINQNALVRDRKDRRAGYLCDAQDSSSELLLS